VCVPLNANELVLSEPFLEEGGASRAHATTKQDNLIFVNLINLMLSSCFYPLQASCSRVDPVNDGQNFTDEFYEVYCTSHRR